MSTELSKATLERKDKDELTQIAVAMGGKPASRPRKAQIVDLILELAGVTDDPAPAPESAPADDPAGDADASGPDQASASDADAGQDPKGKNGEGGKAATGDRKNSPGNGGNRAANGAAYTADPMADARAADSGQGGDNREAGQQQDGEAGNRRRRRRGRNRDRAEGGDDWVGEPVEVDGYLDLRDDGYGFLRVNGFLPSKEDVYVSVKQVRQFELRKGDHLAGAGRPANRSEKNPALVRIDSVNGRDPDQAVNRVHFDDLTAVHPDEHLQLATNDSSDHTGRMIDLFAPVGKGQRAMIAAPPAANKLEVLQRVAQSLETNHPDVDLLVLLLDERPEDVTEMERSLTRGEVISSTFDRPADEHVTVADLTLERARRMVESGRDVVILFDGLTRLVRAQNMAGGSSGRQLPGGIDANSLHQPKRFFGAARNLEDGGSLTVFATVRIGTESGLDKAIFEEFAETPNMELWLDPRAAERRISPPIDPVRSGTRRADLLVDDAVASKVTALRDELAAAAEVDALAGLRQVLEALAADADNVPSGIKAS